MKTYGKDPCVVMFTLLSCWYVLMSRCSHCKHNDVMFKWSCRLCELQLVESAPFKLFVLLFSQPILLSVSARRLSLDGPS